MLLGYNSNGLTSHRLEDALRLLADLGYDVIALTPDVGHLDPLRSSAREVDEVAALLDSLGLRAVVESGSRFLLDPARKHRPNLLERSAAERGRRVDFLKRHIEIAAAIAAPVVSLWSGVLPDGVRDEEARDHMKRGLDELLACAEQHDIVLGFEPEPGMWLESVAAVEEMWTVLGRPARLGLTLDVGHLLVTGEGTINDILPRLSMQLVQVHLEDMRPAIHEHLPPGEGCIDFAQVFGALHRHRYAGPVCWELSRSSHDAPRLLRLCKEVFGRQATKDQDLD